MTASVVTIQPVSLPLAPVLAGIHAASFGPACWSVNQIEGSLSLATTRGWIGVIDGMVAGFLLCQVVSNEFEVLTFAVHPSYQRQGVGEALLRHMLGKVTQGGAAFLDVAADNAAARQLYEKCGFVEVNIRKGYYLRPSGAADAVGYRYFVSFDGRLHQ